MADFNASDYFARRTRDLAERDQADPIQDRFIRLQRASQDKARQLAILAGQQKQEAIADSKSVVGRLGLDPNTLPGEVVNLGAAAVEGTVDVVKNIGSGIHTAHSALLGTKVPDEAHAAYQRHLAGVPTDDDTRLLAQSVNRQTPYERLHGIRPETYLERIQKMENITRQASQVREGMDVSSIVHRGNQRELIGDLREGYQENAAQVSEGWDGLMRGELSKAGDVLGGVGGLIATIGSAAADNPMGAAEFMAQNAPQIVLAAQGATGLALTNLPYALNEFGEGIDAYRKKHDGAFPPEAEVRKMAGLAASLALAETLGDKAILGIGKAGRALTPDVDDAAKGFKAALSEARKAVGSTAVGRIVGRTAGGAGGEFLTEGYQSGAEAAIKGEEITGEDVFVGGSIGAMVGGGLASVSAVGSAVTGATPEGEKKRAANQSRAKLQNEAIKTGDVSKLLDKKADSYAPDQAVAALFGNSQLADTTEEQKTANREKASGIVAELQGQLSSAETLLEESSPEGIKRNQDQLAQVKAELDQTDPTNTEKVAELEQEVKDLTSDIEASQNPKETVRTRNQVSKLNRQLKEARKNLEQFDQALDKDVEVTEDTVIDLAIRSPDRVSPEQARSLASSSKITAPQRTYLTSFAESKESESRALGLEGVRREVLFGSDKNVGIAQYRTRVASAMRSGNQQEAQRAVAGIQKFQVEHASKAQAAREAISQGLGTLIAKDGKGVWSVVSGPTKGAVPIKSPRLVQAIEAESDALNKAAVELQSAYDMQFKPQPASQGQDQGGSNVQNVSQGTQRQPAQAPATQAQGATGPQGSGEASAGSTKGGAPTDAAAAVSDTVEADGVAPVVTSTEAEANSKSTQTDSASSQASSDALVNAQSSSEALNQSTQESTQTEGEQNATQQDTVAVEDAGKLLATSQKSPEGTSFQLRNLIADFFTQSAGKEGGTKRPLVAVKDFLSTGANRITEFLGFEPNDQGALAWQVFQKKAKEWFPTIQANLFQRPNPEFFYEDLMNFFHVPGEKLDIEENLKTAIVHAAFSYIAEKAGSPSLNGDDEINAILDRDESTRVNWEERNILGPAGTRQPLVVNSLGQKVVQALGYMPNPDAPRSEMAQLESQLGAHVFKLLLDLDLVQRHTLSGEQMKTLRGEDADTNVNAAFQFIQLARNEQGELAPAADEIYRAVRGSQGMLDKLFGSDPGLREPSLQPKDFTQTTTKNSTRGVPKKEGEVVQKANHEANFLREDMWNVFGQLSMDTRMLVAGAEHLEGLHLVRRLSVQAKNDGLRRELEGIEGFVTGTLEKLGDDGLRQPFYFEHNVKKQQRVHIDNNVMNPQSSKVARHMVFRQTWTTEVDPSNQESRENFELRVAEGLGIKTDRLTKEGALRKLEATLQDPVIQAGIDVLQKAIYQSVGLNQSEQEALIKAVAAGGENFHSLDALMSLAHAKEANGEVFSVQMMGEVDGVANGPILSHLLMGAARTAKDLFQILNRGGFFEMGNAHDQYNVWRAAEGHLDLYESTSQHMTHKAGQMIAEKPMLAPIMKAVYSFTGTLVEKDGTVTSAGRKIIKTSLTPLVFGSSLNKAVDSMADDLIEKIYLRIEDAVAKGKPAKDIVDDINTLILDAGIKAPVVRQMSAEQLLETELSDHQVNAIKKSFKNSLGVAVKETMQEDFADFLAQRKQMVLANGMTFSLYEAAFNSIRDKFIAEEIEAGRIAHTVVKGEKVAIHDLKNEQHQQLKKRLRKLEPILHTLMSQDSNSLASGLSIAKSKRKLSPRLTHKGRVRFGSTVKGSEVWSNKEARYVEQSSLVTTGYETTETSPGVAMAPMSVHSTDSAISHYAAFKSEILNVHDAHGSGLGTFQQTAQNLNQATWDAMLRYSPMRESYNALARTVRGLADLINEGELPPDMGGSILQTMQSYHEQLDSLQEGESLLDSSVAITRMLSSMYAAAYAADSVKLEAMAQMRAIDQYALEGGNYVVTDADRADAQARRAALSDTAPQADMDAALVIQRKVGNFKPAETTEANRIDDELSQEVGNEQAARPFGPLGESSIAADPDMVALFKDGNEITANQLIRALYRKLRDAPDNRMKSFNLQLLERVRKTVDLGMTVRMVTPTTRALDVITPMPDAMAWYSVNGSDEEINVLSPAFVSSGMTVETMLHELTHAALARTIDSPKGDAKALVKELETLLTKAREFVAANSDLDAEFSDAVTNVQELVAYGMTNQDFQRRVLNQLEFASETRGNPLITGFKKFIDTIVGLLFAGSSKSQQQRLQSGMSVLVSNVAGLFNATQQGNPQAELNLAAKSPVGKVNTYSTVDIHLALDDGKVSQGFSNHLQGLLGGIVEKLHGPFGSFKETLMKDQALSPMDVWAKARDTGKAPFASKTLGHLAVSQQEAHALEQVEATVEAALTANESLTTIAYKELSDLFTEARKKIRPSQFHNGDWATATFDEKERAQKQWDFIFTPEMGTDGRSDYLARFAALGLAHEKFNRMLQVNTDVVTRQLRDAKTFADRIQILFEQILDFFNKKFSHTFAGQRADEKLEALVKTLVDIEAKKRYSIARKQTEFNPMVPVEDAVQVAADKVRQMARDIAGSNFIQNSASGYVRGAGAAVRMVAEDRVDQFMEAVSRLRDRHFKGRQGIFAGIINDVKGPKDLFQALLRATKNNERTRKATITSASSAVLEAFAAKGKDMTRQTKAAISAVFLRTGAHVLVSEYSMSQLEKMLGNNTDLNTAITAQEARLDGVENLDNRIKAHWIEQANVLGYYRATGKVKGAHMLMNAYNIARLSGTGQESRVTEDQAALAERTIESLVALYAIQYSDSVHRLHARQVLEVENKRGKENGVKFALLIHGRLEAESQARLFGGNRALMQHGYTPEIYNPHTEIKVANEVQGKILEDMGYVKGSPVARDPADPDRAIHHIYKLADGGLQPWLTGAFSFTGKEAKGSKKHDGYLNPGTLPGQANAKTMDDIASEKQGSIRESFRPGPRRDLTKVQETFMAPLLNETGKVVNYRYLMQENTKNDLLERDNDFARLIGVLAGSIYDKETTRSQNKKIAQALKSDYDSEFAKRSESFIQIGPKVADPEMRELWNLLPDDTQEDIKRVWGYEGLVVRSDHLDILFGYRKMSLANIFKKEPDARNHVEAMFADFTGWVLRTYAKTSLGMDDARADAYSTRAAQYTTRVERAWQEVVREIKDIIVVKSSLVLWGNIYSNFSLLWFQGVSFKDMAKHHLVALKGATTYQSDTAELMRLEAQLETGYTLGNDDEIKQRIVRLKDSLARNPVKELIDAGLMPTIVEDLTGSEDIYSYKSEFARKTDRFTANLHPLVKDAGKIAYMSHDTKMYQGLSRITQLSDFVARYTLYQHLVSRRKNPLSKEAAVQKASDAFVNYDIPMHRGLQYTDDMGLTMFTKYFLRIQKVLFATAKEHPARVMSAVALGHLLDLGPIVLEGSALTRIPANPIEGGAFEYPFTLDELSTVNAAMTLLK